MKIIICSCICIYIAADLSGTCMTLSFWSTSTIEDVGDCSSGLKWFQLYLYKNENITLDLIRRVERSGFKALVVLVDTPYFGKRYNDLRNKFALPSHLKFANYTSKNGKDSESERFFIIPSLTWDIIPWLRSVTNLKIILKGILTSEDAHLAVQYGVDGILVSNHGARQLDTVPATVNIFHWYSLVVADSKVLVIRVVKLFCSSC